MRITIIAPGSSGDVQPCVPPGKALRSAGHRVRVATLEVFASMAASVGLSFHPIHGDPQALLNPAARGNLLTKRINPCNSFAPSNGHTSHWARNLSDPALRDTQVLLNQLPAHLPDIVEI